MAELIVVIGEEVGEENLARLRAAHPDVEFRFCPGVEEFIAAAADADVLFSKRFPPSVWAGAGRLRWVQAGTAGVNHLLDAGLRGSPVILTNAVGAHGVPMAEVILAMMLAFATRLHLLIHAQRTGTWIKDDVLAHKFELAGQTLCVIGLGDIGGTLALKAKALGMRVLGVRRSRTPFPGIDAQYTRDQLLDVLPGADHVALCLPLTDETQGVIGEAELHAMKSSAYIYNVGRGASINADALLRALHEGWIAGAGLDVTDPEPLPKESPLWTLPNVILSQHTSGSSPHNADRITGIFLDNLGRFRRGEPLRNVVDKTLGY
jgi:phosphoglycerate dehydrogenase-like enzyme